MKRIGLLIPALLWSAAALAAPDAGVPGPVSASPDAGAPAPDRAPALTTAEQLLVSAIGLYQRSEFERARARLGEVLKRATDPRGRTAMEAHLYLGFVHVAYGEKEAAEAAFTRALEIDAELSLPVRSPAVEAIFKQARRRFLARVRATDHDPPRLRHAPPAGGKYGVAIRVAARATDLSGVKRVVLNYRLAGNRGFSSVTMEPDGKGGYLATVPGLAVARPGVEYYIAAWDRLNNGPGLKGSSGAPIKVKVEGGPLRKGKAEPRSWYQRWWVWAAVAGVAVAAGGVALGVYFNRDEVGRIDARLPGTELDP